ncbi:tripartite tricarboxylate transporter substrate binding protein [Ahrensia kielensis]|uniref:Tripartite tricarboxylate transporter substrate binding protein n=1 Tax=Ahrensia kielensis TaxID=76980 RepID=A0ABU9T2S3_9HYPH
MKFTKVVTAAVLALGASAIQIATPAVAADYPERPITMIVPWGAGGGTDTLARLLAEHMEQELDTRINVVNQTGGGGVVGHSAMAEADPDGYTIGLATVEFTTFRALNQADLGGDSYTGIRRIAKLPGGVTVSAAQPWETLEDFVEAVRNDPEGTYTGSGCNLGCSWHLALAGLLDKAGVDPNRMPWVPGTGGAQALQDVVSGGVTVYSGSLGEGKSMADGGLVKHLAVFNDERTVTAPDVPTVKEQMGFDWSAGSWFALVAPKDVPADVIAMLNKAVDAVEAKPEYQDFLNGRGFIVATEKGVDFDQLMKDEEARATVLIEKVGPK